VAVGSKRHAGTEHFIIRQPDRTLALLPAWMTEPGLPANHQLVRYPRLAVERLLDLGALVDALMASCQGVRPVAREPAMRSARRHQRDLFEPVPRSRTFGPTCGLS
jgi:hypothetical protein